MRGRTTTVLALAIALGGLAAWRGACVLAGPDIDTDAYAHHMIARAILADPTDLAVHWVWLPLFHYLQVPFVALGGTMNGVRWTNVLLSAALPVVLFTYVRGTATRATGDVPPDVTALVAALFAAVCPIAMQMGTTAQYEPLFALVTLAIAIAYQRRRYVATAAWLGAGVLLRYEAWAVLAAVSVVSAWETFDDLRRRQRGPGRPAAPYAPSASFRPWIAVAVPAALILGWAALRRPVDGKWFGFLGQTHQFANQVAEGAHRETASRGWPGVVQDALYYPLVVPLRVLGPGAAARRIRYRKERGAIRASASSWSSPPSSASYRSPGSSAPRSGSTGTSSPSSRSTRRSRRREPRRSRGPWSGGRASFETRRAREPRRAPSRSRPRSRRWRPSASCSRCGWGFGEARSSAVGRSAQSSARTYDPFPKGRRSSATTRRSRCSAASIAGASTATGWTIPRRGTS